MIESRLITLSVVLAACLNAGPLEGQSLLERTPNLSGGWLGATGTLQFNFIHRFAVSSAPAHKVSNSPTFFFSYRLPAPVLLGVNYATSSDISTANGAVNEFEGFARYATNQPLNVAAQLGYNYSAKSVDGEVTVSHAFQPLRLIGVARLFSHGYGVDTTRYAVGAGAVWRLGRWVALAGDATTLIDRRPQEELAWSAALQLGIPYSPHTVSFQVTNTNTGTLEGASRGLSGKPRGGFEFTIPFTFSRYFGRHGEAAAKTAAASPAAARTGTKAEMRTMTFAPNRIEIAVGTTVVWTNNDPLVHTITADDGSWDSGAVDPGKTWSHTFSKAGEYAFHCTPHPFMKGVVVVR
ncbi:MAG TPA: cupredoxin family copper-binding protein [Gemmatimonadales bacterium]|nr:cupredoxin family copper-binding protein [Gemmatimonadales bacterium]